jgi:hypothetical protein
MLNCIQAISQTPPTSAKGTDSITISVSVGVPRDGAAGPDLSLPTIQRRDFLRPGRTTLSSPEKLRMRPAEHGQDAAFTQRDRRLETIAYFAAVLEFRIHLPPAVSRPNHRFLRLREKSK